MGEQDFTTSLESAKTKSRSRENKEENMTKGIKTVLTVAVIITCTGVMAGPRHHHHHKHNNGVRLATDIVNLVGAGLNILAPRPVVVTAPAVVAPRVIGTTTNIVAPAPVYTAPAPVVYTTPAPVYYAPPPPPPPRHHHHHHHRPPHHGHRR